MKIIRTQDPETGKTIAIKMELRRFHAFLRLADDLHYGDHFKTLSPEELTTCKDFIVQNGELDHNDFVKALHRRLIDPKVKRTKNHLLIDELLAVANQIARDQ